MKQWQNLSTPKSATAIRWSWCTKQNCGRHRFFRRPTGGSNVAPRLLKRIKCYSAVPSLGFLRLYTCRRHWLPAKNNESLELITVMAISPVCVSIFLSRSSERILYSLPLSLSPPRISCGFWFRFVSFLVVHWQISYRFRIRVCQLSIFLLLVRFEVLEWDRPKWNSCLPFAFSGTFNTNLVLEARSSLLLKGTLLCGNSTCHAQVMCVHVCVCAFCRFLSSS